MYDIQSNTIEFYYNNAHTLDLAEIASAYRARTFDGIDQINYSSDEEDFGENSMYSYLADAISLIRKWQADIPYFGSVTTPHGSNKYSGFFVINNAKTPEHLVILIDIAIKELLWQGVLSDWYLLVNQPDAMQYYSNRFAGLKQHLNNLFFLLRKPSGDYPSFVKEAVKKSVVGPFDIPAKTEYLIAHSINNEDYSVSMYDSSGTEINVMIVQRKAGFIIVYSNVAIAGVEVTCLG